MRTLAALFLVAITLSPTAASAQRARRVRPPAQLNYATLDKLLKRFSQEAAASRLVAFNKD